MSATLGTAQLKAGLLAGGIGLILVVIYSLIYYRALGLVTIASLLVSGGLTFGCLVILGREIGFTLTLAGIAGFIVAVGITADSFVVFFERIKDEVHEGRIDARRPYRGPGCAPGARSCPPTRCRSWPPRSCTTSPPAT